MGRVANSKNYIEIVSGKKTLMMKVMREKSSIWTKCKWWLSAGEIKLKSRWLVQNNMMLC